MSRQELQKPEIQNRNNRGLRLVAYQRTSTDHLGQVPERQGDVIGSWARMAGHEILAYVKDDGTSGAVPALQRQCVLEAIALAEQHHADGIVVEAIDRWSRLGPEALAVDRFFLRIDHDLRLVIANTPPGLPQEMEELWDAMMAAAARAFRDRLRAQIKSGLARAKKMGWPKGRPGCPAKPDLTEAEMVLVLEWREKGVGWKKCAHEVSRARQAFESADPKQRRQRCVSETWLRAEIDRLAAGQKSRKYRPDTEAPSVQVETAGAKA